MSAKTVAKKVLKGSVRLGYPCVNLSLKNAKCMKKVTQKTLLGFTDQKKGYSILKGKSDENLDGLSKIVDWNYKNHINFYRIYSDLFTHVSNHHLVSAIGEENSKQYRNLAPFEDKIKNIGQKIYSYKMRVSFHPNEFMCLGSPTQSVMDNGIIDLAWHARMVDIFIEGAKELGAGDAEAKKFFKDTVFILHGGGMYGDKKKTLKRWGEVYDSLPDNMRTRIVLENDERNFSPMDLLPLCQKHKIPMCVDFFHQECYELMHPDSEVCDWDIVLPKVLEVWKQRDMKPKFHVSRQQPKRRLGTHSHFCDKIPEALIQLQDAGLDFDIMLECKAKDLALADVLGRYKERYTLEYGVDEELMKKVNGGKAPDLELLPELERGKELIGEKECMTPAQRWKELQAESASKKKSKKIKKVKGEVTKKSTLKKRVPASKEINKSSKGEKKGVSELTKKKKQ